MSKQWKPVRLSDYYRNRIAKGISNNIWETMFKLIFEVLSNTSAVWNSKSEVINALQSGRIYYENGAFKAADRFSNDVAKELETLGAKFRHGAYYIERNLLPIEIDNTISMIIAREAGKITALNALLLKLSVDLTKEEFNRLLIEHAAELMYKKLEKDLIASTSEGEVPTVGEYTPSLDLEIADKKIQEIESYWEETDKKGQALHDVWEAKDSAIKDLEDKLKDAKGSTKEELEKELNRTNPERENARQELHDFREQQQKNAPTIDIDDKSNLSTDENNGDSKSLSLFDTGNPAISETTKEETPPTKDYEESLKVFKADKWTKKISQDYVYNMKFWVKKWKAKKIIKMRHDVLKMVQGGARIETIQKYFGKEWKIAKDKAAFLARNESEIASSVLKAIHYQQQGCKYFFWLKSNSKEKRELHLEYAKEKNNKYGIGGTNIFAYDNPPIIEQIEIKLKSGEKRVIPKPSGQKGLPGQTYNCGCNQMGVKDKDYWIYQSKVQNAKRNIFTKIKFAIENSKQRNNPTWRYRRFGEGQAV